MSAVGAALREHALREPGRIALADRTRTIDYGQLLSRVAALACQLRAEGIGCLGLLADNGLPWVLADLAAHIEAIPLVPLPLFFSPQQMTHAIIDSGMDALLTDHPVEMQQLLGAAGITTRVDGQVETLALLRLPRESTSSLPAGTAKVTYTSGTTGMPKGVCLSRDHIEIVTQSLREATGANADDRHLCLTPMSTLLENIGGVYVPLLAGACSLVLPLVEVGLSGASGLQVLRMIAALVETQATSAILAPQMLAALVAAFESGVPVPASLRFLAVGGAPVSPRLLERAQAIGLPVFEGYGLSECASVVTLNASNAQRRGSQGRPLPHLAVSISGDGEVMISGPVFLGYLGHSPVNTPWATGDLGYIDVEGFLHLRGRRKNQFITSFGRNVAPDWVEGELTANPAIAQAAVFGEARPFNVAVLTAAAGASAQAIAAAIAETNARLPDYARIAQWFTSTEPFGAANGQLTTNGRIRRAAIQAAYQLQIESFYQEETHDVF